MASSAIAVASIKSKGNSAMYARAFGGLFLRDVYVLRRELFPFAIRVCMNPLLFLFVFTYIMPHMSGGAAMNPTAQMAGGNFSTVLLPGLMAVAIMFSGIAAVALPLAQDFGSTREIDDRVMCPLPYGRSRRRRSSFPPSKAWSPRASSFRLPTTCRRRRCWRTSRAGHS